MMYGRGKSDSYIVAVRPANKADHSAEQPAVEATAAEPVERREETKGNASQQSTCRTQSRISVSQALERIRQTFAVMTRGRSRMRESCMYGSVRGVPSNGRPYRDRREFITLLGGAAAAWPIAARAQQQATLPVVGMLRSTRAEGFANLTEALRAGLSQGGYEVGRNVAIEYRWADDQPDRLPALVAELIRKPVAVIVGNTQAALAAKAATRTVPIVVGVGPDPIRDGLVTSFNRPGGTVTGISFLSVGSAGKRLELLRQLVPGAATIAVLVDPSTTETIAGNGAT